MTYRFDLVAVQGHLELAENAWEKIRFWLSEYQPAAEVILVGAPPSRIRVLALGAPAEVAPNLLSQVEALAGTGLRVEMLD
ncbi:hypothetical protein [Amnibacterium setariae]|uniref:Uncharacterized protein n=1 Tax=Amnibacterium setariae TaxID=2306585 RepID=A0A3A1U474_9MICO|nr:hypothetical protein [Amnibacterium setariae]RIX28647.1 hypothetical protein D1781_14685 [Amnibacterium setariae]